VNRLIFAAIQALLQLNAAIYGVSASREVTRDLAGTWKHATCWCGFSHGEASHG
jgi:hypothetical protein